MRAGNVEVAEVGRIGLVEVVVGLEERSVGRSNHWFEQCAGAEFRGFAYYIVVEDAMEDTILRALVKHCTCRVQRATKTYCPCERHVLPVEEDEKQQRNSRCATRPCQERSNRRRPVDAPCCISSRSEGDRHNQTRRQRQCIDFARGRHFVPFHDVFVAKENVEMKLQSSAN